MKVSDASKRLQGLRRPPTDVRFLARNPPSRQRRGSRGLRAFSKRRETHGYPAGHGSALSGRRGRMPESFVCAFTSETARPLSVALRRSDPASYLRLLRLELSGRVLWLHHPPRRLVIVTRLSDPFKRTCSFLVGSHRQGTAARSLSLRPGPLAIISLHREAVD